MDPNRPYYVNTNKAARWTGLSERRVRELCALGRLDGAWHVGSDASWMIPVSTLEAITPTPADPTLLDELIGS